MRVTQIAVLGLTLSAIASAETFDLSPVNYPAIPKFVRTPTDFTPGGWKAVAIKSGDLNGDRRPDVAVLIQSTDLANVRPRPDSKYRQDDTNPYMVALGVRERSGYRLVAVHHKLFPREVAPMHGDDPPSADTIEISRGVLSLYFGHLRGFDRFRFRWNGKAFALIGFDCGGAAGGSILGLSANYLTRRARIERGEVGKDRSDSWTVRIRPDKRPTLNQIDWEYGWIGQDTNGNDLSC